MVAPHSEPLELLPLVLLELLELPFPELELALDVVLLALDVVLLALDEVLPALDVVLPALDVVVPVLLDEVAPGPLPELLPVALPPMPVPVEVPPAPVLPESKWTESPHPSIAAIASPSRKRFIARGYPRRSAGGRASSRGSGARLQAPVLGGRRSTIASGRWIG